MSSTGSVQRLSDLLQAACRVHQEGGTRVSLTLHKRQPRGRTAYLAGRGSPRGEVVSANQDGTVVVVEALDLAAWCCAQLQMLGVKIDIVVGEGGAP